MSICQSNSTPHPKCDPINQIMSVRCRLWSAVLTLALLTPPAPAMDVELESSSMRAGDDAFESHSHGHRSHRRHRSRRHRRHKHKHRRSRSSRHDMVSPVATSRTRSTKAHSILDTQRTNTMNDPALVRARKLKKLSEYITRLISQRTGKDSDIQRRGTEQSLGSRTRRTHGSNSQLTTRN